MLLRCCAQSAKDSQDNSNDRRRAIFDNVRKWVSGTELTYAFEHGPPGYVDAMRDAFDEWNRWVGLSFREVQNFGNAKIRITFEPRDGSWSYIGRDILQQRGPTMNIGWSPKGDPDVALHEIGHSLGLHHEHQHFNGLIWDKAAVIADLGGAPNFWSRDTIEFNVFQNIAKERVTGTNIIDTDSIMMYSIPAAWIATGEYAHTGIRPSSGLSAADKLWAKRVYPNGEDDEEKPPVTGRVAFNVTQTFRPGEQSTVAFEVVSSGPYVVETSGDCDITMVVFEDGKQLIADDNSGEDRNARVEIELTAGRLCKIVCRSNSRWLQRVVDLSVSKKGE